MFEVDRTQASWQVRQSVLWEATAAAAASEDHGSVFDVHETAFRNVPYSLV